jgi:peptide chain release factor subunit 1
VLEKGSMLEWLANDYKTFGCNLEFVTDRSEEGSQFVRGFGGIGGRGLNSSTFQLNLSRF